MKNVRNGAYSGRTLIPWNLVKGSSYNATVVLSKIRCIKINITCNHNMWHDMAIIILCFWSPSSKHRHDLHSHQLDTLISIIASGPYCQLLLLQLSLMHSDKVKQLQGVCISYNKETTIRLLPVADNFYKTWSSHKTTYITSCLDHITSQHALQKQVRHPLLCSLQNLRGCYGLLEWTIHTYDTKTTTVIYQVCCFNLHKDRPQSKLIQLKLEKQTPASHLYAKLVACCRWNQSHERIM